MNGNEKFSLTRKDGKKIDVVYYKNEDVVVNILNIKKLNFEGTLVKNITKQDIHNSVLKNENKIYLLNKSSNIVAGLSKKHLNKIISTVFTRDTKSRNAYLKKELISNVELIFYLAVPILKHNELKKEILYNVQLVHRLAIPIKIGGFIFLAMITVKERTDFEEVMLDEFTLYDLHSQVFNDKEVLNNETCDIQILLKFVKNNLLELYS